MSWRAGSAFTPLGAANTAITVTTTTAIASGERVILVVWRQQALTGNAPGNPTVSTLNGNAFTTLAINETFVTFLYSGLSFHSFVAPSLIASGATMTVTPGNANQVVAAMLIVQGDPHPTQAPYAQAFSGRDAYPGNLSNAPWPGVAMKGMTWDKRLLICAYTGASSSSSSPWVQVIAVGSTPLNGYTEALDATQFSYGFGINIREQDSTDSEQYPEAAGQASGISYPGAGVGQAGYLNLVRAGAVQITTPGSDVLEYIDVPSKALPGAGSRPLTGQLWPRRKHVVLS
jgi:hypothetical protein